MDTRQLGDHSVFATIHWNVLDADGQVVRDTWTSYRAARHPGRMAHALVHESLLMQNRVSVHALVLRAAFVRLSRRHVA